MNEVWRSHWYVAFHPAREPGIWTRWLRPGYQHCFAFAPDASRWLVVDGAFDLTLVTTLDAEAGARMWARLHQIGATVLLAEVHRSTIYAPRLIATCATLAAALLGVRGFCALTPFRLYRRLLAKGAVVVMEP